MKKNYRGHDWHLYLFTSQEGRFESGMITWPCIGFMFRVRDPRGSGRWRHLRVRVGYNGKTMKAGRGVFQFEIDSWMTKGANRRISRKLFVRFKAGLGGTYT